MFEKIKYNLNIYRKEKDIPQLLEDISEVRERYNKIKDHKPRASKKLAELGLLIGSAYRIDKEEANEMWDYLIDLNVKDNPEYAGFYIVSVFRKICLFLGEEDSLNLLRMSKNRLLFFWKTMPMNLIYYEIIQRIFFNGDIEKTKEVFSFCYEGIRETEYEYELYSKMIKMLLINDNVLSDEENEYIIHFLEYVLERSSDNVIPLVKMVLISKGKAEYCNLEILDDCFSALDKYDKNISCNLFLKIISKAMEEIGTNDIVEKWIQFLDKCDNLKYRYPDDLDLQTKMGGTIQVKATFKIIIDGVEIDCGGKEKEEKYIPPVTSTKEYLQSGSYKLVRILLESEELLTRYFSAPVCLRIKQNAVYHWISEKKWEQLIKFIVLNFENTLASQFMNYCGTFQVIEPFISNAGLSSNQMVTMSKWNEDNYGRDWKIIDDTNRDDFKKALSSIYYECKMLECSDMLTRALQEYGFEFV